MIDFTDIQQHCLRLKDLYSQRDAMDEELRRMFHMEWSELPRGDWIRATMSPSAYNAAIGAVRLLTSAEPQFHVPFDESDGAAKRASEKLEQSARAMWNGSGRVSLRPAHYDVVLSGLLFGEVCAMVVNVSDLLDLAERSKNKGHAARLRAVAAETPYVFKIFNPAECYPDFDSYGLRGMLRRVELTYGELQDAWGQMLEDVAPLTSQRRRLDTVIVNDWWDWECRCVWLESYGNAPIYHEEHGLEFLPLVAQITDGTLLWSEPERQRFPLLYPVWKSGLWQRENLSLTTMYSLIFALGSNPLLKRKTNEPGAPLQINRTIPGGVVDIAADEELGPLAEKVIDPEMWKGLEQAQGLIERSTIPRQTLGVQPEVVTSFSAISLLTQSGRLPLMGAKALGGAAIANLIVAALRWWKKDGQPDQLYSRGRAIDLSPVDVPERILLECILEPDLPQDKMNMANVGLTLTQAGLASKRWVRENILNIGQSEAMDKEVWTEQRLEYEVQKRLAELQQSDAMKLQARLAPAQPIAQGKPGMVPPGLPEVGPGGGGASPYPPGGPVGEGEPLSAPLPPPEMMGGG